MKSSSSRFKSLAVTAGISFWFIVITSATGLFSIEITLLFVASALIVTQIFSKKISKGLDIFAVINTKIFLGILFIFLMTIYGILFKILRIDLLRLRGSKNSYWLDVEEQTDRLGKQY